MTKDVESVSPEEYLKVAKKAMETLISDHAENEAVRQKYLTESQKPQPFFRCPTERQYHLELFLEGSKAKKVIDLLDQLDKAGEVNN